MLHVRLTQAQRMHSCLWMFAIVLSSRCACNTPWDPFQRVSGPALGALFGGQPSPGKEPRRPILYHHLLSLGGRLPPPLWKAQGWGGSLNCRTLLHMHTRTCLFGPACGHGGKGGPSLAPKAHGTECTDDKDLFNYNAAGVDRGGGASLGDPPPPFPGGTVVPSEGTLQRRGGG